MKKAYLGANIYVEFDGFFIIITTEQAGVVTNRIAFDAPEVRKLGHFILEVARREKGGTR